jgi:hypothetical protein
MDCTHVRTFLYYLCSPQTGVTQVRSVNKNTRTATVRIYGPIAEDGSPVYVEMTLSGSTQTALKINNIARLLPEEILLLREKLKEHTKQAHVVFDQKGECGVRTLFKCLGLPVVL